MLKSVTSLCRLVTLKMFHVKHIGSSVEGPSPTYVTPIPIPHKNLLHMANSLSNKFSRKFSAILEIGLNNVRLISSK